MKILVTGAAGFIGMNCALRLLDRGDEVMGIDNLNNYYSVALKKYRLSLLKNPNFKFHKLDLHDIDMLAGEFDIAINLAVQLSSPYSEQGKLNSFSSFSGFSSAF